MNWFKHDSDATIDGKLRKLILRYGTDGYAIYFHCLELIAGGITADNITFELEHDSEIIADNLKVKAPDNHKSAVDYVQEIMRYIVSLQLFENKNGTITCMKMLKRLDLSMTSNPKMKQLIVDAKTKNKVMIESCCSHDTIMQEENRKEENRTDKKQQKKSVIPTIQEVEQYAKEKCPSVNPQSFFNYYSEGEWKDGNGKQVKNWKLKMQTWHSRNIERGWKPEDPDKPIKKTTCEHCGSEYTDFCRNPTCPGYL